MTQPTRPRIGPAPIQRRHILDALDQQARAIAAGQRFGQRVVDRQAAEHRRAHQSQYRGIVPRWYQQIEEARGRR